MNNKTKVCFLINWMQDNEQSQGLQHMCERFIAVLINNIMMTSSNGNIFRVTGH